MVLENAINRPKTTIPTGYWSFRDINKVADGGTDADPADHDEFTAIEAFDLAPQTAVAGRVSRIGALRDDALELEPARMKYTSPAALPASEAAWIMLKEVMPSGKTSLSSFTSPESSANH